MKKLYFILIILLNTAVNAQKGETNEKYFNLDTVLIAALMKTSMSNTPYPIQVVHLKNLLQTPRQQLMLHLAQCSSVSNISVGSGINKPVIRGLSFNHIRLMANNTPIDNQTWDDRHDLGVSDNGFDQIEIVTGPASLIYGPNAMGGALIMEEKRPSTEERRNGYLRLGFNSNSIGGNLNAGIRGADKNIYYTAHAAIQAHTNYLQGNEKETVVQGAKEDIAPNSKFNNVAFKGMIGVRKGKNSHQLTYNLYDQNLGIIEDERVDSVINGPRKQERDYEMEAPYQHVSNNMLSLENVFNVGRSEIIVNAGYQLNKRTEFEPDSLPKSKRKGVGLDLNTLSADIQWHSNSAKPMSTSIGLQSLYQYNKNFGNVVLVPDARSSSIGLFILNHITLKKWNFLYGMRMDRNQMKMFTTLPAGSPITIGPDAPKQNIEKVYWPYSFSAGAVYRLSPAVNFKVNVARGYSSPNYAQLTIYGRHEGTYRFETGNNNLKMEKNVEADAAIEFLRPGLTASLNLYNNSVEKYIYLNPTSDSASGLKIYRWFQKDAVIRGIESNILLHPENIEWFTSELRVGIIRGKMKDNSDALPYIPANKFIESLTFNAKKFSKWEELYATIQLSVYSRQNKTASFEDKTEGYFLTDLFLGGKLPLSTSHSFHCTVFCTNLFDKGYFNHLSLIKSINIMEPGRNVGLQIQYQFNGN